MDDVCTFIVFVDFQVSNGIYIYIYTPFEFEVRAGYAR